MSIEKPVVSQIGQIAALLVTTVVQEQVNCFNCEHCDMEGSLCRKFGSQPPFKIIKNGCNQFSQTIPF